MSQGLLYLAWLAVPLGEMWSDGRATLDAASGPSRDMRTRKIWPGSNAGNDLVAARFQRAGSHRHVGNVPHKDWYPNSTEIEPGRKSDYRLAGGA
jgi:hypothetical protein